MRSELIERIDSIHHDPSIGYSELPVEGKARARWFPNTAHVSEGAHSALREANPTFVEPPWMRIVRWVKGEWGLIGCEK